MIEIVIFVVIAYLSYKIHRYIRCKHNERIIRDLAIRLHFEDISSRAAKDISEVKMNRQTGKIFTLKGEEKWKKY